MVEMENLEKYRCKLCFSLVSDEHFEEIKDADRDILDVLLLRLNFDERSKQILCNACSLKVMEAYIFKSKCLSIDNILMPYVDNESECSVDLREIYAKEAENKQLIDTSEGHKVCRLCMQLVRDAFTTINDLEVDMIKKYIPEINFNVVHDPGVCGQCFDSFSAHSNFLKNCLEMQEKIKDTHHTEVSVSLVETQLSYSWIKTEEIDIKFERGEHKDELLDVYAITPKLENKDTPNKTEYMEIKMEDEDNESDVPLYNSYDDCMNEREADVKTTKNSVYEPEYGLHGNKLKVMHSSLNTKYKHNLDNYKVKYNDHLVSYQQIQENTSDVRIYKCHMCDYKAKYKCYIARHHLIHLDPSEVEMYTCDTCNFRTKHRNYLVRHQRIHKDPSQVRMHHCGRCDFTTKNKNNLVKHQLLHKDPSEVQMYNCDICDFTTKYKRNLINHQLVHKQPSEVQMYECDICHFKCKRKWNLKNHQVGHRHFSEIPMYKCDVCDYENKSKANLLFHQQKHKDSSQVQMYKCNTCDYATKYKSYLIRHQRVHRNLYVMQMYKCDLCSYETEYKRCLNAHQCKLKNPLKWNQEVIEKINKSILSH